VFDQWEIDHGPESGWQLIEPVDGFHPNQVDVFRSFKYGVFTVQLVGFIGFG